MESPPPLDPEAQGLVALQATFMLYPLSQRVALGAARQTLEGLVTLL